MLVFSALVGVWSMVSTAARFMLDEFAVVSVVYRTYAAAHQAGDFDAVFGFVCKEVGDRWWLAPL
ncbi:hypothetical protein [Streptomyces sp. NPDC058412]|uniref:hypothetical protein n=1 Tax=Streptomyces sp. NPDC058412 TaxID=3346486 RepID=UPI00364CB0FE